MHFILLAWIPLWPTFAVPAAAQTLPSLENVSGEEGPSETHYRGIIRLRNGKSVTVFQYSYPLELSPDQSFVAFRNQGSEYGLYLVETGSGAIRRDVLLLDKGYEGIGNFAWSPDGRYVAFTVCNQELYPKRARLFIADVRARTHVSRDVYGVDFVGSGCVVFDPLWSPSGDKVGIPERRYVDVDPPISSFTLFKPDGQRLYSLPLPGDIVRTQWTDQNALSVYLSRSLEAQWDVQTGVTFATISIPGLVPKSFSLDLSQIDKMHLEFTCKVRLADWAKFVSPRGMGLRIAPIAELSGSITYQQGGQKLPLNTTRRVAAIDRTTAGVRITFKGAQ